MNPDKKWYKNASSIFFFIILFLIFIFFIILRWPSSGEKNKNNPKENENMANLIYQNIIKNNEKINILEKEEYFLGTSTPKVTIVFFSDFSCPYCKNTFPKIREASLKFNNLKIIYKDLPLHDNSINQSMAARCAGDQGLFWPMFDKLFQNQDKLINANADNFKELANQVGADTNKFTDCFTKQKFLPQIKENFTEADNLDFYVTPVYIINGYKIEGDIPYDVFMKILDKLTLDNNI